MIICGVLLVVVAAIIKYQKTTIDRIAPSTEELRAQDDKMGALRLTEKEVKDICQQLNSELTQLNNIKWVLTSIIILFLAITLWIIFKFNLNATRFDALNLVVFSLLLFFLHSFVYAFSGGFYGGHNASMDIRIGILFGTFIVPPFLFYTAYSMNKKELTHKLHNQKWIANSTIALTILSLLLALIIGIGALFTPSLSGNISYNLYNKTMKLKHKTNTSKINNA